MRRLFRSSEDSLKGELLIRVLCSKVDKRASAKETDMFKTPSFLTLALHVQAGSDSQTRDFATIVYRMQLLGMNAVRIPFSFLTLYNGVAGTFAGGCPTATYDQILAGLTPPAADPNAASNAASAIPTWHTPGAGPSPSQNAKFCGRCKCLLVA